MRITNLNKWEDDIVKALKCHCFVEGLEAIGKNESYCEIAYENKTNHYEWINHNEVSHDCICVALYNVYRITTWENKKGVFVQIGSDNIEFYKDEARGYKYQGSCHYEYSTNKISYIMEFTTKLNRLLEV